MMVRGALLCINLALSSFAHGQELLPDMLEITKCAQNYLDKAQMPEGREQITVPLAKIGCQTHLFPVSGYFAVFSEDKEFKHFYIISPERLTQEQIKRLPLMQLNRADLRLGYIDSSYIFHTQFIKTGVDKGVSKVLKFSKQTDLSVLSSQWLERGDYFSMEMLLQKKIFLN